MDQPPFFPGTDHPALREKLHRYLSGLQERLASAPFAGRVALLLLAGGYGRGEGGVFLSAGAAPTLYNDLEFYLVLKTGREDGDARAWCEQESHRGEEETGVEVEFKILTHPALCRAGPSMFYYDLLSANVRVFGDESWLAALPARLRDASAIPAHEATRLLFNRGTGLLFCEAALRTDSGRVRDGFVERNHAKARLAFADAVLALNGRYDFSARERQRRVAAESLARVSANWTQLAAWHEAAVEFKFHPRHENPGHEELARRQKELVDAWRGLFLWVESVRLGQSFADVEGYGAETGRLFPESSAWRNRMLHARDALRRKLKLSGWSDYPRAALQRVLALLMGTADTNEGWRRAMAAEWLGLSWEASRGEIEEAYRRGWQYYN